MVAAVVIAVVFMMLFAGVVGDFVQRHPTVKMLALSFLLLIGVTLIADGFGQHIPRGYIYFAMGFSVFVEMLNLRLRKSQVPPLELRQPYTRGASAQIVRLSPRPALSPAGERIEIQGTTAHDVHQ
jgi:predicted tellurium resistance membrane protein TerC